jgi:hypothetical protein
MLPSPSLSPSSSTSTTLFRPSSPSSPSPTISCPNSPCRHHQITGSGKGINDRRRRWFCVQHNKSLVHHVSEHLDILIDTENHLVQPASAPLFKPEQWSTNLKLGLESTQREVLAPRIRNFAQLRGHVITFIISFPVLSVFTHIHNFRIPGDKYPSPSPLLLLTLLLFGFHSVIFSMETLAYLI